MGCGGRSVCAGDEDVREGSDSVREEDSEGGIEGDSHGCRNSQGRG